MKAVDFDDKRNYIDYPSWCVLLFGSYMVQ